MSDTTLPVEVLLEELQKAVQIRGLIGNPSFELLAPPSVNVVFADRNVGLVARVRKSTDCSREKLASHHLRIEEMASAGAPVCSPKLGILAFVGRGEYIASFWPLGKSRLITASEFVDVVRGMHTTIPPIGLRTWFEMRHGSDGKRAEWLRRLTNPPDENVIAESEALMGKALARLEVLLKGAPPVLLHGDAHPQNIIEIDGRLVAIDLDDVCVGPAEADLTQPIVQARRYPNADPDIEHKLLEAYGQPINTELLEAMVHARTCSKVLASGLWSPRGGENEPNITESLTQRLEAVKNGGRFARLHGTERYTAFADSPVIFGTR